MARFFECNDERQPPTLITIGRLLSWPDHDIKGVATRKTSDDSSSYSIAALQLRKRQADVWTAGLRALCAFVFARPGEDGRSATQISTGRIPQSSRLDYKFTFVLGERKRCCGVSLGEWETEAPTQRQVWPRLWPRLDAAACYSLLAN